MTLPAVVTILDLASGILSTTAVLEAQFTSGGVATTIQVTPFQIVSAAFTAGLIVPVPFGGTGTSTLTANGVVVGNGTSAVQVTAAGTALWPLIGNGTASSPSFQQVNLTASVTGVLGVVNGGSGTAALAVNQVLIGNDTAAFQVSGVATSGLVLTGNGTATSPTFQAIGTAALSGVVWPVLQGGTGTSALTVNQVLIGNGTTAIQMSGVASAGFLLTGNGTGSPPTFQAINTSSFSAVVWPVSQGGTNTSTLTQFAILYGNGTATLGLAVTGTGAVLNASSTGVPSMTHNPVLGAAGVISGSLGIAGASGVFTQRHSPTGTTWALAWPPNAGTAGYGLVTDGLGTTSWTGMVFSIAGNTGLFTLGNGVTNSTNAIVGDEPVNAQTGTTYTVLNSDRGKLVTFLNAAAIAVTLPQAGTAAAFPSGWYSEFRNISTTVAGIATITPATSTINGTTSYVLLPGSALRVVSNGTNYLVGTIGALPNNPTVQRFTTGSGTYTTPSGVKWIWVLAVGGGGGGGPTGTASSPGTIGSAGGSTTFGSIVVCTGGGAATVSAGSAGGGAGGTATVNSPAITVLNVNGQGGGAGMYDSGNSIQMPGGAGGNSMIGGGGQAGGVSGGASAGAPNSGGGGSSAGRTNATGAQSGAAGGAGGGMICIVLGASLASTYTYAIGAGGAGGTAGGGGSAGLAGGSGGLTVQEFYS